MPEADKKYGLHQWGPARPPANPNEQVLDGPIESKCKLCGAWIGNFGDEPMGGTNQQDDPHLCGCNPIANENDKAQPSAVKKID
jgi:hypothetical protein